MCTPTIPAAIAGPTSLSTRSPTYAIIPGSTPASSTTRAKNAGSGLCTPQRLGRADDVDVARADPPRRTQACCRTAHDAVAGCAQPRDARQRVRDTSRPASSVAGGMLDAEQSPDVVVMLGRARSSPPGRAISVNGVTPPASATRVHMSVSSTSVSPTSKTTTPTATRPLVRDRPRVVTFSSRSSPGTTLIRPPFASTSDAQSDPSPPVSAARSTAATNACGVWTVTSSSRRSVSCTTSSRTRFTVSTTGRPGTAPSKPSASASITRSITSSWSSGRAASWTRITARRRAPRRRRRARTPCASRHR